jgi:hypothetical protein
MNPGQLPMPNVVEPPTAAIRNVPGSASNVRSASPKPAAFTSS